MPVRGRDLGVEPIDACSHFAEDAARGQKRLGHGAAVGECEYTDEIATSVAVHICGQQTHGLAARCAAYAKVLPTGREGSIAVRAKPVEAQRSTGRAKETPY